MHWARRAIGAACMAGGVVVAVGSGGNENVLVGGVIVALLGLLMLTLGGQE